MGKGTVFEPVSLGKKVGIGSVSSGSDRTSHDLSTPSPSREVATGNCCRLCQDLDKGPVHVRPGSGEWEVAVSPREASYQRIKGNRLPRTLSHQCRGFPEKPGKPPFIHLEDLSIGATT